jgi:hypothetical protein
MMACNVVINVLRKPRLLADLLNKLPSMHQKQCASSLLNAG